jgi:hypothetical protein
MTAIGDPVLFNMGGAVLSPSVIDYIQTVDPLKFNDTRSVILLNHEGKVLAQIVNIGEPHVPQTD